VGWATHFSTQKLSITGDKNATAAVVIFLFLMSVSNRVNGRLIKCLKCLEVSKERPGKISTRLLEFCRAISQPPLVDDMDNKGGEAMNPISRKIFARVKDILAEEPNQKIPDVDNLLDSLCAR
jgi:hypothetical protein